MITEEHIRNNLNRPERCSMRHKLFLIFLLVVFSGCSLAAKDHSLAQTQSPSLNSIFRQVNPAVVEIAGILDKSRQENSNPKSVLGSGVIISKDGHVLTSSHVVDSVDTIMVRFLDGTTSGASIVSSAAQADVALLQLDDVPPDLVPAMLGDSNAAEVGDQILISGNLAEALNVPQEAGLLVQKVAPDSLAEEMGLVPGRIQSEIGGRKWLLGGDIILDIQGTRIRPSIKNLCALNDIVGGFTSSSHIEMTVLRNGQKLRLSTQP